MRNYSYDLRFNGSGELVVKGYRDPLPRDVIFPPRRLFPMRRPRVEIGRIRSYLDKHRTYRYRVDSPELAAGSYQFQHDAINALYRAAFPDRKLLVIHDCEHTGDLERAMRILAAADVAIIDSGIDDDEYETGWIEVDDPRSADQLYEILHRGEDSAPDDFLFGFIGKSRGGC